ncbi:recombinase family protein [Candidatus Woesearchaeota archaeon]|nr:recombinase family protein [Candidatus Woesearchaeota archaeon]
MTEDFDDEDFNDDDSYMQRFHAPRLPLKRRGICYLRQSSHEQLKKRKHSLEMQEDLRRIAVEEFGYRHDQVIVIDKDLGISGTLNEEDRPGLAELVKLICSGGVESVFVVQPDRLYRDQTLVGPLDFALDCQKHDVFVVYLSYRGPCFFDFNKESDFEEWIRMSQESAKELKDMQVRMGGARFYKAKGGKYSGGMIRWGWKYNAAEDQLIIYEPHRQTLLNILRVASESFSLHEMLVRVKRDPKCWFHPFQGEDADAAYRRHIAQKTKLQENGIYVPQNTQHLQAMITHPLLVGVITFCSGRSGRYKVNLKKRKHKRGKFRTGINVRHRFVAVQPSLALFRTEEELTLFWNVQGRHNPIDLKYGIDNQFKKERLNPNYRGPERGGMRESVSNPYAYLIRCGLHGFDEQGDFLMTHPMRASHGECWSCRKDLDIADSVVSCTNIRQRVFERVLDTHIRLRLSQSENMIDDLVRLVESHERDDKSNELMLRQKLANINQAIENFTTQLREIDVKTSTGKMFFAELQERIVPLLLEKHSLENRLSSEKNILGQNPSHEDVISVENALRKIADDWSNIEAPIRNRLLRLIIENIVVYAIRGKRTVFIRIRWKDGYDDWLMFWYWGERNNERWEEWEDNALRQMWESEASVHAILAALKPGRKWRTIRPHARQLGLKSLVRRPGVAEVMAEQDKESVPTDDSETLVYYFLGRVPQRQSPNLNQSQEVHQSGKDIWFGKNLNEEITVFTSQFPSVIISAPTATSTLTPD